MSKEIILVVAILVSIVLVYVTLVKLNSLSLPKVTRVVLTYLTVIVPILGFILVFTRGNKVDK